MREQIDTGQPRKGPLPICKPAVEHLPKPAAAALSEFVLLGHALCFEAPPPQGPGPCGDLGLQGRPGAASGPRVLASACRFTGPASPGVLSRGFSLSAETPVLAGRTTSASPHIRPPRARFPASAAAAAG